MIVSKPERGPMRHIPEDELHAYLDQALSRTQCVEIESHLADCPPCRATRDGIAALRDRTTALLARLAPPPAIPPAFDRLRRHAAEVETRRRRRIHVVAWAASLVAAVGIGWSASSLLRTSQARQVDVRRGPRVRHGGAYPVISFHSRPFDSRTQRSSRGRRALAPVAGGPSGAPITSAHGEAVLPPARGRRALAGFRSGSPRGHAQRARAEADARAHAPRSVGAAG